MPTGDIYQWESIKKIANESGLIIYIRADGYQVGYPDGGLSPMVGHLNTVSLMVEAFNHGRKSVEREG